MHLLPVGPKSDTLMYVDLPVVDKQTCCSKHCDNCNAPECVIFDHNICAGYEEGGKDACSVSYSFFQIYI